MLYPTLEELLSLRERRRKKTFLSRRLVTGTTSGQYLAPFRGRGLEFDAVREYVFGDDVRSIDWRVTARRGVPHLKVFQVTRERRIFLCIDANARMRFGSRVTFKSVQAAKAAAWLGWQALARQEPVSVYLFGDVPKKVQVLPAGRRKKSFYRVLRCLTSPPAESHAVALEEALEKLEKKARKGALVYVISDFASFVPSPALSRLQQKCQVVFIAVHDPLEEALPPMGLFEAVEGGSRCLVNTDDLKGREAYAQQWKAARETLKEFALKGGIPLIELLTTSNVAKELHARSP